MKEHSFIGILENSGQFNKIGHQIWINFINILPLEKINNGCVNFKFIMNFANKKLTNVIYDS